MSQQRLIKFDTVINRLRHLNMCYLEVPKNIVQRLGGKISARLLCTVNGSLTYQCGLVALGEGRAYISINSKRMKQLGVKLGDGVSVTLKKDDSKYGMEVPAELSELLRQDDEGRERFSKLSPGKQRYTINYVSTVKSSRLRIERAIFLIENLKRLPVGKETFRGMLGMEGSH